jgi:hypothetical protein
LVVDEVPLGVRLVLLDPEPVELELELASVIVDAYGP